MRKLWALLPLAALACAFQSPPQPESPYVLLLSGDTNGYLSPCGCTKPMTGGIRRRIAAYNSLKVPGRTVILENGGLASGSERQQILKSETLAEILGEAGVEAVNWTRAERALPEGEQLALRRLLGDAVVGSKIDGKPRWKKSGPFIIAGLERGEALPSGFWEEAQGLVPLVMLHDGLAHARTLARANPALRLIQYSSSGNPPSNLQKEGNTLLVTTGDKARHAARLLYQNGRLEGFALVRLDPEFSDDPLATELFGDYLQRVDDENLLEQLPRHKTARYVGSQACFKCHANAAKVWKSSAHAHALKTLEKQHEQRDPECVSCHVVGLESTSGFRSRAQTPHLADVGCESCHGPGAEHAAKRTKLPKVGKTPCLKCHTPSNSPNFNFSTFWSKIKHR